MNNLSIVNPDVMTVMAKKVAMSGLFGVKNENQVYSLMLIAESEGIHPMKAMQQFHIINGKPALKSSEVLSRFQLAGGSIKWIKTDDTIAEAELSHPQGGNITIKWDIEKAKKAGVYDSNPVWKKYPSNMLRARVVTDGVNALYPACLGGNMTEAVAQDIEVETEEVIDTEIETIDIDNLKRSLARKLEKHGVVAADIKDFATKYNLGEDTELLTELVNKEELLLEKVNEFEKDGE